MSVKCPHCSFPGEQMIMFVNPGGMRRAQCFTCKGTNQVDAEYGRRIEVGQRLREERVSEGITLRKAAEDLGCSPITLSHVESGHLVTSQDICLWSQLTGESLTFEEECG